MLRDHSARRPPHHEGDRIMCDMAGHRDRSADRAGDSDEWRKTSLLFPREQRSDAALGIYPLSGAASGPRGKMYHHAASRGHANPRYLCLAFVGCRSAVSSTKAWSIAELCDWHRATPHRTATRSAAARRRHRCKCRIPQGWARTAVLPLQPPRRAGPPPCLAIPDAAVLSSRSQSAGTKAFPECRQTAAAWRQPNPPCAFYPEFGAGSMLRAPNGKRMTPTAEHS